MHEYDPGEYSKSCEGACPSDIAVSALIEFLIVNHCGWKYEISHSLRLHSKRILLAAATQPG